MTEKFQNAVVVGKVTLPAPKKEVVVQKKERPAPPPKREERPKQMKRFGDQRPQQAANQAMLQELQYIKKQLRAAEEKANAIQMKLVHIRDQVFGPEFVTALDNASKNGGINEATLAYVFQQLEELK